VKPYLCSSPGLCPAVHINNTEIPQASTVRSLGLHLDSRLTRKQHIVKKRKQMDKKVKDLYWIIVSKTNTSLDSKVLLYKTIIRPICVMELNFVDVPVNRT
jgi:hypothetical protein